MPDAPSPSPLRFAHPDDCHDIRAALDRGDFTHVNILQTLAAKEVTAAHSRELPILLRRTAGGRPLDTLIRLFVLGMPVETEAARTALATMPLARWQEAGFVTADTNRTSPRVKLLPFKEHVFAFDLPHGGADFVMGVAASSATLANLTIRRPVASTLDLGTGCGVQACLAAPHSTQVTAVDRNPRAVHFAAFNAQLNGLANVACRAGDRFAPVADQQFDLIVSNPPFVISPAARYTFRDSGLHGDQFCQQLVRAAPAHLREGGFCQLLCNWTHLEGEDWRARLATWFTGIGCDVWVLRSDTSDPSTYAATWIQASGEGDPAAVGAEYDEWMAYYRRERIEAISFGSMTMRRRTGGPPNWLRTEDAPERMLGPCGEEIARGFALRDFVQGTTDEQLLDASLRVSPDVRLEQQAEPSPEGWHTAASRMRLVRGLAYVRPTDALSAALVGRCTGAHPLRALVADLATSMEADLSSVAPACVEVVRRLIERGFLLPPDIE